MGSHTSIEGLSLARSMDVALSNRRRQCVYAQLQVVGRWGSDRPWKFSSDCFNFLCEVGSKVRRKWECIGGVQGFAERKDSVMENTEENLDWITDGKSK